MAEWVGQLGSEAIGASSNPSLYLHFLPLLIRRKIIVPPLCMRSFETRCSLKPGRDPLRSFLVLWDKKFRQKGWYPPLMLKIFWYPKLSETPKGSPTKCFGSMRRKSFRRKSWYTPLMHKIFGYPKLLKHERVPLRKISVLWEKTISTENRDTRPLLLSLAFLHTGNFLKHRRVLYEMFRYWHKKILTENRYTSPLPSCPESFPIPEMFWSTEGFPYEIFRHCETKNFQRKIVLPLLLNEEWKSVVELMFVKNLWKLNSKQ